MRTLINTLVVVALTATTSCATQPPPAVAAASAPRIEVAFSPGGGSEALVVKVLDSARLFIRLAAYSFTSPAVVRGLMDAQRRGVDVKVLVDDRGNRGKSSIAAMNLIAGAGIPIRATSYAIHHDKYIVVDGKHTETGSFNYSQAAAKSNSEDVLVVWDNASVAGRYLAHWENRWAQGFAVESSF
ncbi:phospholipase D family protein [Variovorax rhizosphaerae]|uniref:phospholipase D n=1 Tax=Variovorax rhizosphaerae TaxID=1836200 RepID=A0ABU8WVM4_9BURK